MRAWRAGRKTAMIHSIFPPFAVLANGPLAARVGDKFGTLFVAKPCEAAPKKLSCVVV
jgi:hypothetical protein